MSFLFSWEFLAEHVEKVFKPYAEFCLIFGSFATQKIHKESDLDIAVYFLEEPSWEQKQKLLDKLKTVLEFENMDLVSLNSADLIITYEVFSTGKVCFVSDWETFVGFKALKTSQYLDFKISRKIVEDNILKGFPRYGS